MSTSRLGDDTFVIAVDGELDMYTVEPLRERLADVLEGGARRVLLDLMGVTFIDSVTLALLIDCAKALRASGGRLVLVAEDPRVTRTLEITGLDHFFEVEPSLPEAVRELIERRPDA